jgi:crotonobetainyl-CoA:carnitine CoA-transferase CaiB-like acyl-CoA transferase
MRLDPMQYGFGALERLYPTADGWICLVAPSDSRFAALREVVGGRLSDTRFATRAGRTTHDDELALVLEGAFVTGTTAHWLQVLGAAGVPVAAPLTERNAVAFLRDPENRRTGRAVETPHPQDGNVREVDQLIRVSDAAVPVHRVAPELGADTAAVLASFGYDEAAIDALRARRAIRTADPTAQLDTGERRPVATATDQ